jgi:hypothetical protein
MITAEELGQAIDETLAPGCGGCGRSLPRPGVQCPECGAWPDITREEAAAALSAPGELTLHKADAAERQALDLMHAFIAATVIPDRLRKRAEIEQTQAEVQEALGEVSKEHGPASQRLAEAAAAEAGAKIPLDEAIREHEAAQAALEEAERTLAGPKAEIRARHEIAAAAPVVEKYQRLYDAAAAKTLAARRDVERCESLTSMAEQARDEQAARLLHLAEVRPSARRVALLAHPLVAYMNEMITDHNSEHPRYVGEWAYVLGLLHQLAGAAGLLVMAEEGATPRVLGELAGPLSRADDVAAIQRRLAGSRLQLPPGPGEASMSLVRNTIR